MRVIKDGDLTFKLPKAFEAFLQQDDPKTFPCWPEYDSHAYPWELYYKGELLPYVNAVTICLLRDRPEHAILIFEEWGRCWIDLYFYAFTAAINCDRVDVMQWLWDEAPDDASRQQLIGDISSVVDCSYFVFHTHNPRVKSYEVIDWLWNHATPDQKTMLQSPLTCALVSNDTDQANGYFEALSEGERPAALEAAWYVTLLSGKADAIDWLISHLSKDQKVALINEHSMRWAALSGSVAALQLLWANGDDQKHKLLSLDLMSHAKTGDQLRLLFGWVDEVDRHAEAFRIAAIGDDDYKLLRGAFSVLDYSAFTALLELLPKDLVTDMLENPKIQSLFSQSVTKKNWRLAGKKLSALLALYKEHSVAIDRLELDGASLLAIQHGRIGLLKLFLPHFEPDRPYFVAEISYSISDMVKNEHYDMLKYLHEDYLTAEEWQQCVSYDNYNAFYKAVKHGRYRIVDLFLDTIDSKHHLEMLTANDGGALKAAESKEMSGMVDKLTAAIAKAKAHATAGDESVHVDRGSPRMFTPVCTDECGNDEEAAAVEEFKKEDAVVPGTP